MVGEWREVGAEGQALRVDRELAAVRAPRVGRMAARAGGLAVEGDARIPEERPAELHLGALECRRGRRLDAAEKLGGIGPQLWIGMGCGGGEKQGGEQGMSGFHGVPRWAAER